MKRRLKVEKFGYGQQTMVKKVDQTVLTALIFVNLVRFSSRRLPIIANMRSMKKG